MLTGVLTLFLLLLLAKTVAEIVLDVLNRQHIQRFADTPPGGIKEVMDDATYRKSVEYSLAKNRFSIFNTAYDAVVLALILVSGLLPLLYGWSGSLLGHSVWAEGLFLVGVLLLLALPGLPLDWWAQFRLEERFGFNRSTLGLWIADRVKGTVVAIVIGYPLATLLLAVVGWAGDYWWIWGFVLFFAFQLLMIVVYPMFIMPLFNKFSPLPEGGLRRRLMDLADRTGFKASTIQVMDGSKRSSHSNAFFTGFGRFRRIVLFDTLVEQLEETELEAVLAHEIGHYKRKHIPRVMALSGVMAFLAFWAIAWLAESAWFYEGFGFPADPATPAPAFLLFVLVVGVVTFWLSPLFNILSRKHEYEADAFARNAVGGAGPMIGALRKLSEKNLSNLTPHPLYSGFHYSHPTLLEREAALRAEDTPGEPA